MANTGHPKLPAICIAPRTAALALAPAVLASPRDRARIINEAYADYYVPTRISESQMRRMDQIYDVVLEHSVAARAGGEWVGMAMLAQRGDRGWVSSVGVIPAWRRRGLARAMMERLLASARELGLVEVTLEVIDRNDPARDLYEALGFRAVRELLSWRRDVDADSLPAPDERLRRADPAEMLARHFGWRSEPPSWQRDAPTLRYLAESADAYRLASPFNPCQTIGYVIYSDLGDRIAVLDVGADPGQGGVRTARAMLQALAVLNARKALSISNVPVDDPLNRALAALGFLATVRQYEMRLAVDHGF
jgi:ribosomal protein S18 acetylase RimI-like enzyme